MNPLSASVDKKFLLLSLDAYRRSPVHAWFRIALDTLRAPHEGHDGIQTRQEARLGDPIRYARAHVDLGRSWSPTMRIREGHMLVTDGVYGWVRHPIYAALWLIVIAQALLVHNWFYGLIGTTAFALIFFYRIPREEGLMIKECGAEYRAYMCHVGGVIPNLLERNKT